MLTAAGAGGQLLELGVVVEGSLLSALIDSGASHNFISESLAKKLSLTVIECETMTVRLATGIQVYSVNSV